MREKKIKRPEPLYREPPADWQAAIGKAIERVRSNGKISNEAEAITNSKIEAIRSHDPKNGRTVIWTKKENGHVKIQTFVIQ